MTKTILILILIVFPFLIFAKTYYVASTGSNENSGTIDNPFETIAYGTLQLSKGDILYVRGGTYNERVYPYEIGGTVDNPIVLSAYPGESPIIDGTGINISAGGGLVTIGSAYTIFNGFEVQNANMTGEYDGRGGIVITRPNCVISNCVVHDTWGAGIIGARDSSIIEDCTAYNVSMRNEDLIEQENETWSNGISIRGSSSSIVYDCIIRRCTLYNACGEGYAFVFTDNCIIEDCIVYDTFSPAIYVRNSQNTLIQRNLVYMTKTMGEGSSVGIGYWNEGRNEFKNEKNTFINNIVFGARRNFYSGNDQVLDDGTTIANNTFVNSTFLWNVQIGSAAHSGGKFVNNIVIQEDDLACIYANSPYDLTYSNNLYNKYYDSDAVGPDDIIGDALLSKTGSTSAGVPIAEYFKLLSASEAIDAGTDLGVSMDYERNIRDDYPDIGAIEFNCHANIFLYPNPNNGSFTLLLPKSLQSDNFQLTIFSIEGKVIFEEIKLHYEENKHFNLTDIGPGVYIVKLIGDQMTLVKHFIKY